MQARIAIVGRGRAGRALARALREAGSSVTLHGRRVAVSISSADVVLLAVPDDAIADVVDDVRRSDRLRPSAVVLHLAGALGPEVLRPLSGQVRGIGVLHPLQSLADPARGGRALRGAIFAIAGNAAGIAAARRLARSVGGHPVRVRPTGRVLYHAAAAMTSGGTAAILAVCEDAMVRAGLRRRDARLGLLALLSGTLGNVAALGPVRGMTGPVARGDRGTIRRHRRALAKVGPAVARLYDALVRAARSKLR